MKPRLFIASSTQSLTIAHSVQLHLDHYAQSTVWSQNVFQPSDSTLEGLIKVSDQFDFALFVFGLDDVTLLQGNEFRTTRDNVVFELGLFMGKIGRSRCFILAPKGQENFHLPSDLLGITTVGYEVKETLSKTYSALGPACTQILLSMDRLGAVQKDNSLPIIKHVPKPPPISKPKQIQSIKILVQENILKEGARLKLIKHPKSHLQILDGRAKSATYLGGQTVQWDYDNKTYSLSALCEVICKEFGNLDKAGPFQGTNFWAIEGDTETIAARARAIAYKMDSKMLNQ